MEESPNFLDESAVLKGIDQLNAQSHDPHEDQWQGNSSAVMNSKNCNGDFLLDPSISCDSVSDVPVLTSLIANDLAEGLDNIDTAGTNEKLEATTEACDSNIVRKERSESSDMKISAHCQNPMPFCVIDDMRCDEGYHQDGLSNAALVRSEISSTGASRHKSEAEALEEIEGPPEESITSVPNANSDTVECSNIPQSDFGDISSLDDILYFIPSKVQQGFKTVNVGITCFDASENYLLFGSNAGCGFLYNRETGGIMKLLSETRTDVVVSVKLFVGIECQAALGTEDGKLILVILSANTAKSARQVQKFNLGNIHDAEISCLEWSTNGMKLFSGDKNGNMYVAERDFEKSKCNVYHLHNEARAIVDLSYRHMVLLVSTTERTMVFHTNKKDDILKPIGSKSRQGSYGACLHPDSMTANDLQIYCTRPGYRIWIADVEGRVTNTLLLKDLVSSSHQSIDIKMQPTEFSEDSQFRKLMFYQDKYLLAYSSTSFFVLDPLQPSVVASNQSLPGILSVAVTANEIFVLLKDRQVFRIAKNPDEIAVGIKRLEEERRKESRNLQDIKESLSGVKRNLTPFVGALQSKMSSFNEKGGQWTQKLQLRARDLQQKLPNITTAIFTREDRSTIPAPGLSNDASADLGGDNTSSSDQGSTGQGSPSTEHRSENLTNEHVVMSCYGIENPNFESEMFKKKIPIINTGGQDFLHSQGDPDLQNDGAESAKTPSANLYFDKMEKIGAKKEQSEIVFASKRKKSKSRTPSSSSTKSPYSSPHYGINKTLTSDLHSSRTDISSDVQMDAVENSKDSGQLQLFLTMEKTTGNQICPKVVESPSSDDLNYTTPTSANDMSSLQPPSDSRDQNLRLKISEVGWNFQSSTQIHSSKNESLVLQNFHEDQNQSFLVTGNPELEQTSLTDCKLTVIDFNSSSPVSSKDPSPIYSPDTELPKIESIDLASPLTPGSTLESPQPPENQTLLDAPQYNEPTSELPQDLASDQAINVPEGIEHSSGSLSSSSEDIYAIDTESRDFGSEIETDSKESDNDERQAYIPCSRPSLVKTQQSFTSDFDDLASSLPARLLDSWSTTALPHQVASMAGSDNYIWYIDFFNRVYITEECGTGTMATEWKKLAKKGVKLCISPSGAVVWILTKRGNVYASVMPVDFHQVAEPVTLNWQLVSKGVQCVALGHDSAWIVSSQGSIRAQFGISRSNPFSKTWNIIPWENGKICDLVATKSTVWCRTAEGELYAADISTIDDKDFIWEKIEAPIHKGENPCAFTSITSDSRDVVFALDNHQTLWFLSEDRNWWQVNVSEYIDESRHLISHSAVQALPLPESVSTSVHKVQRWMAGLVRAQHVAVNNCSIWIVHDKWKASVARGPVTGSRWDITNPLGVARSSRWRNITTSSVFSPNIGSWLGLVWASRPNGEIFCFHSQDVSTHHPVTLPPPVLNKSVVTCLSACKEALWVLYNDGDIYIRSGITPECLRGTEWNKLDTNEQLGNTKLVHISCGSQNVWAIDSNGSVYFRIGVTAVDRHSLPPAWIPIDGCPVSGHYFTKIECGLSDGCIWAIDNFSEVYFRNGVSVTMPVGIGWEVVPGSHAQQLCISNHTVWGLRISGSVLRRFGISERNHVGDYWKKIKGYFTKIAATPYDELWAIGHDEHLFHQHSDIYCPLLVEAQYKKESSYDTFEYSLSPQVKVESSWEFL